MRLRGFRPLDRGEMSLLAAFGLIVVLAGFGLFFQTFTNIPVSQTAATAAPATTETQSSLTDTQKAAAQQLAQKCAVAIQAAKAAKTSGKDITSQTNQTANDDCISAIQTTDPAYKNTGGYKCVGKSAQIMTNANGTLTINWQANPNSPPGICKTVACQPNNPGATVNLFAKCVAAELPGINKSAVTDALGSPDAFDASRSVGGLFGAFGVTSTLQPTSPLSDSQNAILNSALGNDPNTTTAAIPLDSSGNMVPPANGQIQQLAQTNPDTTAQQQQQAVTAGVCDSNPTLCTNVAGPQYQGPCQYGTMDPTTGKCPTNPNTLPPTCVTSPCGPGTTGPTTGPGPSPTTIGSPTGGTGTFGNGNGTSALNSLLSGLLRGLSTPSASAPAASAPAAPAQTCSTDPNTYAQQQQQYQQAQQQYNYQLQQYQYQQQVSSYYGSGYSLPAPPEAPQQCSPSTQSQCSVQPQQPAQSTCSNGSWQPVYSGNCVVNWQCSDLGAQLSCQPQTADVGMSIAISYSCAQGTASGSGFTASGQSGTSTALVAAPPQGSNTATYALTCSNGQATSGAQCSIQISQPSIILVANPATISSGQTSLLGWVTTGMQSCVVSSPQDATFTSQNSSNTSPNGTATTLAASSTENYLLHCVTVSGGTKDASTTVQVQ